MSESRSSLMRYFLLFLVVMSFFSCKKELTVQEKSEQPDVVIQKKQNPYIASGFSIENARVYDKTGSKDQVNEVLEILYYFNLLEPEKFTDLKNKNAADSLYSNYELIRSCKNTYSFDTPYFSTSFPHFYQFLFGKIAQKEGFSLNNYTVEQKEDSSFNVDYAVISFEVDEKKYSTEVVNDTSVASIDESFYKVLNEVLADKIDSNRYYLARRIMVFETDSNKYYSTNKSSYTILKLSEAAAASLHQYPNVIDLSYEEHRIPLSRKSVENLTLKLDSNGFFKNLKEEELEILKKELVKKTIYDVRDIFYYASPIRTCLSPVIQDHSEPYREVLTQLKKISNGNFKPRNIVDNYAPNSISEPAFDLNGKTFSVSLQNGYDYIDIDGFVQLVNAALNKEKVNGNFYLLNNTDNDFCYIFMNEDQVKATNSLLNK